MEGYGNEEASTNPHEGLICMHVRCGYSTAEVVADDQSVGSLLPSDGTPPDRILSEVESIHPVSLVPAHHPNSQKRLFENSGRKPSGNMLEADIAICNR